MIIGGETKYLDFVLQPITDFLLLSDTTLYLNSFAGNETIEVESNLNWVIESYPDWLSLSTLEGIGNASIEVSFYENQNIESKTGNIVFTTGGMAQTVEVIQYPKLKMLSYKGINGNDEKEYPDSVYVLFNRPINVESIEAWDSYVAPINFTYTDNQYGFRFDFLGAEMGDKYPFTISVSDNEGGLFQEEIQVPYFYKKMEFEDQISDYLFLNDDKEILIAFFSPSKLIHYSIESETILNTIDLSAYLAPVKLSFNPYNSFVYLMGSYPNGVMDNPPIDRPDVYKMNIETYEVELAFTIEPVEDDHPDYPKIYPLDIGFSELGYGTVLLQSLVLSGNTLRIIDSSNGDSLYVYPDDKWENLDFENCHMNYDYTKVYLFQEGDRASYGVFDAQSQQIDYLTQEPNNNSYYITPNRRIENFYVCHYGSQYVLDLNNQHTIKMYLDAASVGRNQGSADFCYKSDYYNFILHSDVSNLYFVDYLTGEIKRKCNTVRPFEKLKSTIDGKYFFGVHYNEYEDKTEFIQFLVDDLF